MKINYKVKLLLNVKYVDSHSERAYSENELKKALQKAGFEVLGVFGDMSFDAPKETEERIYFVAKKVK